MMRSSMVSQPLTGKSHHPTFYAGNHRACLSQPAELTGKVEWIPVRELETPELFNPFARPPGGISRLEEMLAIQQYYQAQQRDMTDIEFETIAQTWSEHCVHKTFRR